MSGDSIKDRVVARINAYIGRDVKELKKAHNVADDYLQQMTYVKSQLNYEQKTESCFNKALIKVDTWCADSVVLKGKFSNWQENFDKMAEIASLKAVDDVQEDIKVVRRVNAALQYVCFTVELQTISQDLEEALEQKNNQEIIDYYLKIYEPQDTTFCLVGRISLIGWPHLLNYATETAVVWYERIKDYFATELAKVMESIRCHKKDDVLSIEYDDSNTEAIENAQTLASLLFTLQPPTKELTPLITLSSGFICQPLSDVINALLQPYTQRFNFHFSGKRKTNRLDKPEWVYTQVLHWGKQAHEFMGNTFQQCAIQAGQIDYNARLEFLRGLVMLAMEKIAKDLTTIVRDNTLFAHLIDETVSFEAELRDNFGYPDTYPSVISVLTQPQYMTKWIALEEAYCESGVDKILKDKAAWNLLDPLVPDDDLKIPVCVDKFVRILDGIRQRYFVLIQPGKQMQFLHVQLQLIDSFRRRLVQLYNGNLISSSSVLNAVNYLIMVLRDWGENVHYLHLNTALVGTDSTEISSVFDEPLTELEDWQAMMLKTYAENIFKEIEEAALPYCNDNWSTMPEQASNQPFLLTPSSGDMLRILLLTLHSLNSDLSFNVFNRIARHIAKQVDTFLFENLIMTAKFSPGGAQQFKFDMTRNLFTLFAVYINASELLFKKINNSIKLLTASVGTALLVHETLLRDNNTEEKEKVLKELDIEDFSFETCIEVLERRTDVKAIPSL